MVFLHLEAGKRAKTPRRSHPCVSGTTDQTEPLPGFSCDISLGGIEVQAAEVKEDVGLEALSVAVTERLLD